MKNSRNITEKQQSTSKEEPFLNEYHRLQNLKALKQAEEQLKQPYSFEQMKVQTDMLLGKKKVDE